MTLHTLILSSGAAAAVILLRSPVDRTIGGTVFAAKPPAVR